MLLKTRFGTQPEPLPPSPTESTRAARRQRARASPGDGETTYLQRREQATPISSPSSPFTFTLPTSSPYKRPSHPPPPGSPSSSSFPAPSRRQSPPTTSVSSPPNPSEEPLPHVPSPKWFPYWRGTTPFYLDLNTLCCPEFHLMSNMEIHYGLPPPPRFDPSNKLTPHRKLELVSSWVDLNKGLYRQAKTFERMMEAEQKGCELEEIPSPPESNGERCHWEPDSGLGVYDTRPLDSVLRFLGIHCDVRGEIRIDQETFRWVVGSTYNDFLENPRSFWVEKGFETLLPDDDEEWPGNLESRCNVNAPGFPHIPHNDFGENEGGLADDAFSHCVPYTLLAWLRIIRSKRWDAAVKDQGNELKEGEPIFRKGPGKEPMQTRGVQRMDSEHGLVQRSTEDHTEGQKKGERKGKKTVSTRSQHRAASPARMARCTIS